MTKALLDVLKNADEDMLDEILREAELRLSAQLTSAIAADTRAMTFLGFIAAVTVASVGGGLAVLDTNWVLAVIAIFVGAGFGVSGFFAFEAARPIDFRFVGNDPASWRGDIEKRISLRHAKAEQVAFYDKMIKSNRAAMSESAELLQKSANIAKITLAIAGILSVVQVVAAAQQ